MKLKLYYSVLVIMFMSCNSGKVIEPVNTDSLNKQRLLQEAKARLDSEMVQLNKEQALATKLILGGMTSKEAQVKAKAEVRRIDSLSNLAEIAF